jgi:CubicO group peptidase (beta-lactamase class C family)
VSTPQPPTAPPLPATRENWLDAPANRWAFQHVDAILSTVSVSRGAGAARELASVPEDLGGMTLPHGAGAATLDEFLERTYTDGFIVLRGETVIFERYLNGLEPSTRHSLMSVSKSIAGMLAGVCGLDPAVKVTDLVPELAGSAYGDATARDVLDMAVAVRFRQEYDDPTSELQREDRAAGWRPPLPGDPPGSQAFLATLRGAGRPGERFQYCSPNTDVLAWMLMRAAGRPYPELLEDLWRAIGADQDALVTVDAAGFPFACAGMCATLRDLARFGRLVLDGGAREGSAVIPAAWVDETRTGEGTPVRTAPEWESVTGRFPDARYHNQWWVTGDGRGSVYGMGIFGQWLWLDPASDTVIAKLSSLPDAFRPQDASEHLVALAALARQL